LFDDVLGHVVVGGQPRSVRSPTLTRTRWIVVGVVVAVLPLAFILLASAGSNGGGGIPGY
jgi:hypothetical protein